MPQQLLPAVCSSALNQKPAAKVEKHAWLLPLWIRFLLSQCTGQCKQCEPTSVLVTPAQVTATAKNEGHWPREDIEASHSSMLNKPHRQKKCHFWQRGWIQTKCTITKGASWLTVTQMKHIQWLLRIKSKYIKIPQNTAVLTQVQERCWKFLLDYSNFYCESFVTMTNNNYFPTSVVSIRIPGTFKSTISNHPLKLHNTSVPLCLRALVCNVNQPQEWLNGISVLKRSTNNSI